MCLDRVVQVGYFSAYLKASCNACLHSVNVIKFRRIV
jgi:hypothetical protein